MGIEREVFSRKISRKRRTGLCGRFVFEKRNMIQNDELIQKHPRKQKRRSLRKRKYPTRRAHWHDRVYDLWWLQESRYPSEL